jgi:RNA polymerase sigma factor (sigma-70 family)
MDISQSQENSVSGEADDGELFALMAAGSETGFAAFDVFYRRYSKRLKRLTCRIEGVSKNDGEDFMQETMLQAYRSAHTFKPPAASLSPAAKRDKTMFWLIEIARNIHNGKLRKLEADGVNGFDALEAHDEEEKFSHFITDELADGEGYHLVRAAEDKTIPGLVPPEEPESEKMRRLKDSLSRLPEKKRKILLAYHGDEYDYRDPHRPLSRELIAELKDEHQVTSENLRQIKTRAFKTVKAECNPEEKIKRKED